MARVNVNTATAAELTEIAGIGPKTAKKIVAYRKKHGKFKKADDLLEINGIGEKTLKKMKSQLKF
jgi:competence protein ComEA